MKIIFFLLMTFYAINSSAASCCGGGFSIPSIILGDDKAQITNTLTTSHISDDVLGNSKWMRRNDSNITNTLKIEGAALLSDYWQAGFSIPFVEKSATTFDNSKGLGDISFSLAHETFPELAYSKWIPKGVTFIQLTLPTSPSIYDSPDLKSSEIRGRGLYTLGGGVALTKSWKIFDVQYNSELHRSFRQDFTNRVYGGQITANPGWGSSQNLGLGVNSEKWRLGGVFSFNYEDAVNIDGALNSEGAPQKYFGFTFSTSYMFDQESSATISYLDQSLLGNPINSALSKSVSFSYQYRWPR